MTQRAIVNQSESFKGFLETYKGKLAGVSKVDPAKAVNLALVAASKNPKLLQCEQKSILRCMMESSSLGIMPFSALNLAYIIPYFNGKTKTLEAQFMLSYRGIVEICRRSDKINSIEAHVVFEKDHFECNLGTYKTLKHSPFFGGDRGEIIAAYAVATHSNGDKQFDIMSRHEIEKTRSKSKSPNSGPWVEFFEEMAKKTVVKRLCKYLPISDESAEVIHKDNTNESTIETNVIIAESDDFDLSDVKEIQVDSAIKIAEKTNEANSLEQKKDFVLKEVETVSDLEIKNRVIGWLETADLNNIDKLIAYVQTYKAKGK